MLEFIHEALLGTEPHLDARIDAAKARARKIANGVLSNTEDLRLFLANYISNKRNIPLFSEYFQTLAIDDLMLEAELLSLKDRPADQLASDITNENKEEADALFDDWATEDEDVWQSVSSNTPELDLAAEQFMKTNQFKE